MKTSKQEAIQLQQTNPLQFLGLDRMDRTEEVSRLERQLHRMSSMGSS